MPSPLHDEQTNSEGKSLKRPDQSPKEKKRVWAASIHANILTNTNQNPPGAGCTTRVDTN